MNTKLVSILSALSIMIPASGAPDEPAKIRFIRVDEDAAAARLQTAVTRYEKNGVSVDLIGAVHIADKAYYEALNKRFEGCDALLYEAVGGEKLAGGGKGAEDAEEKKEADDPSKANLSMLHGIYTMTAKLLGLTGQMESIHYDRPNFVHADLTMEEFTKMQADKGESMLGLALKAMQDGGAGKGNQIDSQKLLQAMLSGKSDLMKLELVHTLGGAEDQINALAGGSVLLDGRNKRCLEVLDREVKAGRKKLGIFYGAAHFDGMAKLLEEGGFKRTRQEWMTAWDIPKPKEEEKKEIKDAA